MPASTHIELKPEITDIRSIKPFHAHVTIEPLERGFGHTLGNALRRVMMSSIPGYAPTEVKIDGVVHEYDRVEGMREDVVWLLLNLKGVVFKVRDGDSIVARVKKEGPGVVTAGDIETPHNAEVVNKDHVLATLSKKGRLDMEITVEKGTGYESASLREGRGKRFGVIYLDSLFSPVRRVAFQVEAARVANRTDLDRLVLDIETNGIMDFHEVIEKAAAIMIDQLKVFANVDKNAIGLEKPIGPAAEKAAAASDVPVLSDEVSKMDLTERSKKALKKINIRYIGELVKLSEKDLRNTPQLGRNSVAEIKQALDAMNLQMGMDLPDWTPPGR